MSDVHKELHDAQQTISEHQSQVLRQNPLRHAFRAMKPRYFNPFYWLMRFIQINREIAAAIPPITEDDLESLRKFSEQLNRLANKVDKSNRNEPATNG